MKSSKLKKALDDATTYLDKIGKPENHFNPTTYGKLHTLEIETKICYQEYPSAQNYWTSAEFDNALAYVVRLRFNELSEQALRYMHNQFVEERINDKQSLLKQLAEIEELEKQ